MTYYGSWKIDDLLTFYVNTTKFDTGVATDADSVPTYRVYEDETATPLLTGSMALLDSANTAGFYSEQITLSAANGFEKGKSYSIYITATVNSVAGATHHNFQLEAEVDANTVSDKTGYSLSAAGVQAIWDALTAALTTANSIGKRLVDDIDATISSRSSHTAADVWAVATRVLTAGTNIVLAKGVGVTGFNDVSTAQVNAEVVDALAVDTYTEPGQENPPATTTLAVRLRYLYKALRNKKTQTATTMSLYDDAGTTVDQKATISDDGVTYTHGELGTGP